MARSPMALRSSSDLVLSGNRHPALISVENYKQCLMYTLIQVAVVVPVLREEKDSHMRPHSDHAERAKSTFRMTLTVLLRLRVMSRPLLRSHVCGMTSRSSWQGSDLELIPGSPTL